MSRLLVPSPTCAERVVEGSCTCPHRVAKGVCKAHAPSRAAVLLGLGFALTGCEGKEQVSADDSVAIHPDAKETPGDEVDSNCNHDDDT